MATTDTSVLANLNELFALEAARIAEERALREVERREAEAKRRNEREAQERRIAEERQRIENERRAAEEQAAAKAAAEERERRELDARLETERAVALERSRADALVRMREQELEHARIEAAVHETNRRRITSRWLAVAGLASAFVVVSSALLVTQHRSLLDRMEANRRTVEHQLAELARHRESLGRVVAAAPSPASAPTVGASPSMEALPRDARPRSQRPSGARAPNRHPPAIPRARASGDCRGPLGSLCRTRLDSALPAR